MMPLPPQQWAESTFGGAELGDKRRTKRWVKVATHLSAHTGISLSASWEGHQTLVEGAYGLMENDAVNADAIAEAGFQEAVRGAKESNLLLAPEDSTTLS